MYKPKKLNTMQNPNPQLQSLIANLITHLNTEYTTIDSNTPILEHLTTNLADLQSANTYMVTLTFNNLLTDQDDPQFLNKDDIEDLNGLIIDYFNSITNNPLNYFTHATLPLTCTDTANPYQAIIITISIEYPF